MNWVSGSLTIFEPAISSSLSGLRRQAFSFRAPLAKALAATLASVALEISCCSR